VKEQGVRSNSPGNNRAGGGSEAGFRAVVRSQPLWIWHAARYSFLEPIRPDTLTAPLEKLSPAAVASSLLVAAAEQGQPVVPIDLLIQPQTTGPNTGKNRYLKTLGLAALMAKVGFVPAREPVELWFDLVLADIGMSSR